jgi:hypothetical protein
MGTAFKNQLKSFGRAFTRDKSSEYTGLMNNPHEETWTPNEDEEDVVRRRVALLGLGTTRQSLRDLRSPSRRRRSNHRHRPLSAR